MEPSWHQSGVKNRCQLRKAFFHETHSRCSGGWFCRIKRVEVGSKNGPKIDEKMRSTREGILASIFISITAHLGAILAPSGPIWAHLGPSWCHLGAMFALLGPILAASWLILGVHGPILAHLGAILAPSWPILAPSWPILASSWPHLGPSWPHLGPILGSKMGICIGGVTFFSISPFRS